MGNVHENSQIVLTFEQDQGQSATLADRYLWGPSVDQLLAEEHDAGGDVSWTLGDDLNSVRDWLHYNGTIDESAAYDAFGRRVDPDSGLPVGPAATERLFGYTGRLFDGATGLQNNLNRWYDANIGRWMSEDPIGFLGGDANLYRYVGNQPTGWIDPSGLMGGPSGETTPAPEEEEEAEQPGFFERNFFPEARRATELNEKLFDKRQELYYRGLIEYEEIGGRITAAEAKGMIEPLAKTSIEFNGAGFGGGFLHVPRGAAAKIGVPYVQRGGFDSFDALKRVLGPAGEGRHWHHIVEQSKVGQFGAKAIHNVSNVISIPAPIHYRITGFYNSIQDFTNGQTVRRWLNGQSFEFQREFGMDVLRRFGAQ